MPEEYLEFDEKLINVKNITHFLICRQRPFFGRLIILGLGFFCWCFFCWCFFCWCFFAGVLRNRKKTKHLKLLKRRDTSFVQRHPNLFYFLYTQPFTMHPPIDRMTDACENITFPLPTVTRESRWAEEKFKSDATM